jgi:hypothetical protein
MNQRLAAVPVLWAALCGACAPVRPDGVCALPEVQRALDTELRHHGIYGTPDTRSFGELTGPEGGSTPGFNRLSQRLCDPTAAGRQRFRPASSS